ncbi:hypothetical protein F5144DRAFT_387171 [Chaetomium tenue]|uniref:Uncharacterized protein n=1 Tax=Chaetomium tenue TaxID=1854479 RepID=A0ACB7NYG3_9PEZI|nr:hypothetical protein F5144DRAFT_387171 [Chaetomium globosum]
MTPQPDSDNSLPVRFNMTPQPGCEEPPKPPRVKGKGARRVSNLSEEQRNKKRENDRVAQRNIRLRNKQLIQDLRTQVDALMRENNRLKRDVRLLRKTLDLHTGQQYQSPGIDVEDEATGGNMSGYYVAHNDYPSPYAGEIPYDHWPSGVVPISTTAAVKSAGSSPRPSAPGEDFTPTCGHAGVPMAEGRVMAAHTSAPSLGSAKTKYEEPEGGGPSTNRYTNHGAQPSSEFLQEGHWPGYPNNPCF